MTHLAHGIKGGVPLGESIMAFHRPHDYVSTSDIPNFVSSSILYNISKSKFGKSMGSYYTSSKSIQKK